MSNADAKIEITHTEDEGLSVQMQGEGASLIAALLGGVNQVYKTFPEGAPRRAARAAIIATITDPDSPVWDTTENGEGTRMIVPVPRKERDKE